MRYACSDFLHKHFHLEMYTNNNMTHAHAHTPRALWPLKHLHVVNIEINPNFCGVHFLQSTPLRSANAYPKNQHILVPRAIINISI